MRNPTFLHVSAAPACPAARHFPRPTDSRRRRARSQAHHACQFRSGCDAVSGGLYRALVIGNDDYEDAELVTPV